MSDQTNQTTQPKPFELGIYTFVEYTPDPLTGTQISPTQRVQNLLAEAELADQVGLDVFAIGEHHRSDYISSAPSVLLSAIAAILNRRTAIPEFHSFQLF